MTKIEIEENPDGTFRIEIYNKNKQKKTILDHYEFEESWDSLTTINRARIDITCLPDDENVLESFTIMMPNKD